jgi:beta-N-acetylhexosaminidase
MLFIKRTRLLIGVLAVGFMMSSILIPSVALAVPSSQGDQFRTVISQMALEEKVGQMFMVDFRQWDGKNVVEINPDIEKVIQKYRPGGVILFKENVVSADQTVRLVDQLQRAAGKVPLLVAIDQEGGLVARIEYGTMMPGNMALGAINSTKDAMLAGEITGQELKALGINVNLAPVADVNINPDNPVIGVRSFGSDPARVGQLAVAYIKGLDSAGVAAAAKHFPGHGDTAVDSHLALPMLPHDLNRLQQVELKPFQMAIDQGVDMILSAHVTFPAIDNTKAKSLKDGKEISVPATLSARVMTDLLRDRMGFEGVIITDALKGMNAINDNFGTEEAVVRAIRAGSDIILMPADLDKAYNAVLDAIVKGEIPESRIDQSVERILALKAKRGIIHIGEKGLKPGTGITTNLDNKLQQTREVVGRSSNLLAGQQLAERAVTLLKNDNNLLPFELGDQSRIVILAPWEEYLDPMVQTLQEIVNTRAISGVDIKAFAYTEMKALTAEQRAAIDAADYVVLGSYSSNMTTRSPGQHWIPDFVLDVVNYTNLINRPTAVMAIRNPYDIMYIPEAQAYLCVYGRAAGPNVPAGIKTVFGETNPQGKLPAAIPTANGKGNLYDQGYGLAYPTSAAVRGWQYELVKKVRDKISGFTDTFNHWAATSINRLKLIGLVRGYPDGSYRPGNLVSQKDAATVAMKLADPPVNQSLVNITSQEPATRLQAALWLADMAGIKPVNNSALPFKDLSGVSSEYTGYLQALYQQGVITGTPAGNFEPQKPVTRAELAVMTEKILQISKEPNLSPDVCPELHVLRIRVQDQLDSMDRDLALAAYRISQTGLSGDQTRSILNQLASAHEGVFDTCTVNHQGIMTTVEPREYKEYEGSDISKQEQVLRLHKTKAPVLSNAFMAVEGFAAADLERPVFSSDRQLAGSVSMLLEARKLFAPFTKSYPEFEMMVLQEDGFILFDSDTAQIGRNTFTDPLYQSFPDLLNLCKQVTGNRYGSGTYSFWDENRQQVLKKTAYWNTVGLHGTEWRIVLIPKATGSASQEINRR